jgi:hypothetical protein
MLVTGGMVLTGETPPVSNKLQTATVEITAMRVF